MFRFKPKIPCQLFCRIFQGDSEQIRHKIDHVPVSPTAKAVISLINFHAGIPIVMERTFTHAGTIHGQAVMLGSFPGSHVSF